MSIKIVDDGGNEVAAGEASLTAQQIQEFLAKKLANFKVPRIVEFRDALPREDTGKIFKRRLQEEYATRQ